MAGKKVTVRLLKEKTTKNAVRYQEEAKPNSAPVIGTLYVQKWWVGEADEVKVTLEVE